MNRALAIALLALLAPAACAFGSALDEARALRNEGLQVLKKARAPGGDLVAGSKAALAKFEAAVKRVEDAATGTPEGELATDLNSLIFWTRRTMPLDLGLAPRPRPQAPPKSYSKVEQARRVAEAQRELDTAETYARAHPRETLTIAARFFAISDRYSDIHHVAFRAISRAQYFQRQAKQQEEMRRAEVERERLSPDGRLALDGDRAYSLKQYDKAAALYRQAIALDAKAAWQRKLGHTHFEWAQQIRGQFSEKYLAAAREYKRARARRDKRAAARAAARATRLNQTLAQEGIAHYTAAEKAFRQAWHKSSRLDIDAEVHMALTHIIRGKPVNRKRARSIFERILRTYHGKLATDEERTLYAHAETYAGPGIAARIKAELFAKSAAGGEAPDARRPRGLLPDGEGGVGGARAGEAAKPLAEMTGDELIAHRDELKLTLRKKQAKLNQQQRRGVFDMAMLDAVNLLRERLETVHAEAARRGLE